MILHIKQSNKLNVLGHGLGGATFVVGYQGNLYCMMRFIGWYARGLLYLITTYSSSYVMATEKSVLTTYIQPHPTTWHKPTAHFFWMEASLSRATVL
ncbi:predicted protein [Lichtheimia corymbifera JMRC:FSU:9682]|uniref:Uncharacterized protein n=1 Tax=Lichtheimia corymbifera JMRC:FSU:9682 TaxID=1263082 RepID=A0A068SAH9_9FUNG|nr:predicted protein [Lichtheimia corymbifera JMRC:FSU:9682]